MGQQVNFKLKNPADSKSITDSFDVRYPDVETSLHFVSEADNQAWLNLINGGCPNNKHLKPKGRDLTMDELTKMFSVWTTVGMAQIDVGFSRTSVEDMQSILAFTNDFRHAFKEVGGIRELISRSETGDQYEHLSYLDTHLGEYSSKLPEDRKEQSMGSGVALLETNSIKDCWAAYGKVKTPTYKKLRTHTNPDDDGLDRDGQGRAFLLVPLMPIGQKVLK